MSEHRPWFVSLGSRNLHAGEERVTISVVAPRGSRSMRKLTLGPGCGPCVQVESLKIGPADVGRELLDTGPMPGILFDQREPELFDAPVEAGQTLTLVVTNLSYSDVWFTGALLGL